MAKVKITTNDNPKGFIYEANISSIQVKDFIEAEMRDVKTEYERECKNFDCTRGTDDEGNFYAQAKTIDGKQFVRITALENGQ